jgi:hypothetical protein
MEMHVFILRALRERAEGMMAKAAKVDNETKLNVWRCTATGAAVLLSLFVLCWIGAALSDLRLSHMFIQLFTTAPVDSVVALVEGACWSLIFGAITGTLFALFYNLFSLGRA